MMRFNRNQRVFWNGTFPNPDKQGTVMSPSGTVRTEVLWDGAEKSELEWNTVIAKVKR